MLLNVKHWQQQQQQQIKVLADPKPKKQLLPLQAGFGLFQEALYGFFLVDGGSERSKK